MIRSREFLPTALMLLLCTVTGMSSAVAAERTLVAEPWQPGTSNVGSMNFTISDFALSQLLSQGGNAGDLQQGLNDNGTLRYIDELLAFPDDAFYFQLSIPNDAAKYGDQAGSLMPYTGYVLYPTTASNTRADYQVFTAPALPKMQGEGEAPLFADESAQYPLLIYSHGVGDHPTADQLGQMIQMASHGYIVMALFHADNRFALETPQHFNLRPLAVKAAIDELLAHPGFQGHIDEDQIGGWGSSYGGATMLALLGAQRVHPDVTSVILNNLVTSTVDTRIKAAAGIVPYAGTGIYSFFGAGSTGTATVDRPFMAHASNADEETDFGKVQAAMNNIPGTKYLIEYDGLSHELSDAADADVGTWIKLFLDAYVKEDADAIATLATLQSVSGGEDETLVLVSDTPTDPGQSGGGSDALLSTFVDNQLTLTGVIVGEEKYDVTMSLTGTEPFITFVVGNATPSTAEGSGGSYANGVLTVHEVDVGGVRYNVQMNVASESPQISFVVGNATPL